MKLRKQIKNIFITLLVISLTAAGYAAVSTVTTGDTLTATIWNDMKASIDSNTAKLTNVTNVGGNIGIGTVNHSMRMNLNGGMMLENSSAPVDKNKWAVGTSSDGTFYLQGRADSGVGGGNMINITRGTGPQIEQTQFVSSGVPFMVIDHYSRNIGIGTDDPTQKLDIAGNGLARFGPNSVYGASLYIGAQSQATIGTTSAVFGISNGNVHIDSAVGFGTYINHYSGGDTILNANAGGNVGIGTSSPAYKLQVNGTAAGTSWTNTSDMRYKKDIKTIDSALEKVKKLRGVSFDWKTEEFNDKGFEEGTNLGFIAQEVEKVLPEIVDTDNEGYKSVQYANITAVLVEAVKDITKQNEELRNRIELLENK